MPTDTDLRVHLHFSFYNHCRYRKVCERWQRSSPEAQCSYWTVLDERKVAYFARLFTGYGERFRWDVVKDVGEEGAFDNAVEGVQGVVHAASPFHLQADDPEELTRPAVRRTLGVLESMLKYGRLHRVRHKSLTESSWNTASPRAIAELGSAAPAMEKYRASNTLAEKAAWEFVATHKEQIKWDLTAINPPLIWGPTIHDVPTAAMLNTSIAAMYAVLKGMGDAGGERFLIACRPFTLQDFVHAVGIKRGAPGAGQAVVQPVLMDTTKAHQVLGVVARDFAETARDSAQSLLEREGELGW